MQTVPTKILVGAQNPIKGHESSGKMIRDARLENSNSPSEFWFLR